MSKDSDYAAYLRGQRKKRLETIATAALTGLCSDSNMMPKEDKAQQAIELAEELIKQIEEKFSNAK